MGVFVEAELLTYPAQMRTDFLSRCVFHRRRIAELFEQRDVDQRFAVTGYAGIPIPVPRPTEVRTFFDDLKVRNAGAAQLHRGQQSGDAAAHDQDFDRLRRRRSVERNLDIGVTREFGVRPLHGDVLRIALRIEPLASFYSILFGELAFAVHVDR
jgi:hypothetical protein